MWPAPACRYLRWHAMYALRSAIRVCDGGTGFCSAAHAGLVARLRPGGAHGPLTSVLLFLYASGAIQGVLILNVWRLPLLLSAATQLYVLTSLPRHFRGMCAGPLATPPLQRDAHRLFQTAKVLLLGSPMPYWLPAGDGADSLDAQGECRGLLSFLCLGCGLALPPLLEARATVQLFERHQQERRAGGLLPEQGVLAALYSSLHGTIGGGLQRLAVASYLLLVLCWDVSTWLLTR
ncbi:hypothetical protein ABPG75_009218 [Micractinium tetrahymenae]